MSIELFHGPASPDKDHAFWQVLRQNHATASNAQSLNSFLVLTDGQNFVNRHKVDLLQILGSPLLMGTCVLSFEDFLLKWIKSNISRVHQADDNFCLYLLFLILKNSSLDVSQTELTTLTQELYQFFLQIKKCGLTPQNAKQTLKSHIEDERVLEIFETYQSELKKRHYFDRSDLYLTVIELLRKKNFKWLKGVEHLYLSQIYPLHAGHREILRLIKTNFPDVNVHIHYNEDFSRPDDLLSFAYEDLGAISDHSVSFASSETQLRNLIECQSPYDEIEFVTSQILALLKQGVPLHHIVVAASPTYETALKLALQKKSIPASVDFSHKVSEFLPLSSTWESYVRDENFPHGLIGLNRTDNIFARQKIQAINALEKHNEDMLFLKSLFQDLRKTEVSQSEDLFLDFLKSRLKFNVGSDQYEICLTDMRKAHARNDRFIFILGFHFENLSFQGDSTFYSPLLYSKREFSELLNFPTYQIKISYEKLKTLLLSTKSLVVTRPLVDFSGKPTTLLHYPDIQWERVLWDESQTQKPARLKREYQTFGKRSYSLTEVQRYIDCPYQYYAASILGLGQVEKENLEPPGDVRGSFAHLILQKLLQDHLTLYITALKDESKRESILNVLSEIVRQELNQFERFKTFGETFVNTYAERLGKVVRSLVEREALDHKAKKKTTLPRHLEWDIIHQGQRGFTIQTDFGPVTLTGRIDRIDVHENESYFSVIDYKTGMAPTTSEIKTGMAIQLPVYMMAVQDTLYPQYEPSSGFYYQLRDFKFEGFALKDTSDAKALHHSRQIPKQNWDEIKNKVTHNVGLAIAGIQKGEFDPKPRKPELCDYCDYKRICGFKMERSHESDD